MQQRQAETQYLSNDVTGICVRYTVYNILAMSRERNQA